LTLLCIKADASLSESGENRDERRKAMATNGVAIVSDENKEKIKRLTEKAVEGACDLGILDHEGIKQLVRNGLEFQSYVIEGIKKFSVPNLFATEEVETSYTYPREYEGPMLIADQIAALAKELELDPFGALGYAKSLPEYSVISPNAEGYFAAPSVEALAKKYFPKVTDPDEKYCRAVELILAKIAAQRDFTNYHEGKLTSKHLRLHVRTALFMELLAKEQKGSDILIFAAQLGKLHAGQSVRRGREVFNANEVGLYSLAAGSIILTHPKRLVRYEELDMDCAGDEYSPDADGDFSDAPVFYFVDGEVEFSTAYVGHPYKRFGSASAFVSQTILEA